MNDYPSAESLAFALDGKKVGNSYRARCPAHPDKTPSFSITDKAGKTLVKCWAGCSQEDVLDALRGMNLWPKKRDPAEIVNLLDKETVRSFILAHENNLRRNIPTSSKDQRRYGWYQNIHYQPYSAAEVAEMHMYCLCYSADVRKGITPGKDADQLFRLYSGVVHRLGVPYEW